MERQWNSTANVDHAAVGAGEQGGVLGSELCPKERLPPKCEAGITSSCPHDGSMGWVPFSTVLSYELVLLVMISVVA